MKQVNYLQWFDRCFCISHPATGRRAAALSRFRDVGLYPSFVYAEQPHKGFTVNNMRRQPRMEFAVSMSHIAAIVAALDSGARRPLFLEDDVEIGDHAHLEAAIWTMEEVTGGRWDVLYLGGHPCADVERLGPHLVRVGRFSFAEAYCINGNVLGDFLSYWCDRIGQPNAMFDRILGEFAADRCGYCVYPTITRQPAGYSFVAEKDDDKAHCLESGWRNHLHD